MIDLIPTPGPVPDTDSWDALEHAIAAALAEQERAFAAVSAHARRYRIVSTMPLDAFDFWRDAVEVLTPRANALNRFTRRFDIPDVFIIGRMLRAARGADAVILTGGERPDLIYGLLVGALPWIRAPHIFADAHWERRRRPLSRLVQKLIHRSAARVVREVQPHSDEEIAIYHERFGYAREIIRPIPWSTSLTGHVAHPSRGDYVLSGGYSFRDYATLLEAVKGEPYELRLGIPARSEVARETARLAQDIANAGVHDDWSNAQFIAQQAACGVLAMPITPGLGRCTADQTILNAMAYGKIVVATDSIGSRVYLRHGENGFLVPESDPAAWRRVLRDVLALDDTRYQRIARQAMWDARVRFGERLRAARTLQAAVNLIETRRARGG